MTDIQGWREIASAVCSETLLVCSGERQVNVRSGLFPDDTVLCFDSREQFEETLERCRYALQRRGMKVSETGGRRTRHRCSEGGLVHIPEVSYAIRGLKECEKNRSNSEREAGDRKPS